MTSTTTTRPTQATRHGITVRIVDYVHDDWSVAWGIQVSSPNGTTLVGPNGRTRPGTQASIPTWNCKDEADARRQANAIYRAIRPGMTAIEARAAAS